MSDKPTILVIGTADTKAPELLWLRDTIEAKGGATWVMDVGVVGEPPFEPDTRKEEVAEAGGSTIAELIALDDENMSMARMAEGASRLAKRLFDQRKIDGMIAIGGTMGTDLACDVALALPLGIPKMIVSSVAFSPVIPSERIAADLMMILWAGGLWGNNPISRAVLEQAAGAVLGAVRAEGVAEFDKPAVAVSSLGQASLKYLTWIRPELEHRGYEVIVFHAVGMGGRAMESLILQDKFVCVLDLALIEVSDEALGSIVSSGESRLRTAGQRNVPQIIAPGAIDGFDYATWMGRPENSEDQLHHAHNRLISVVTMTHEQRQRSAEAVATRVMAAKGPTKFVLPTQGIDEWDRPGAPLHDAEGFRIQVETFRELIGDPVEFIELDAHINDKAFSDAVMRLFDEMVEAGAIPHGENG